MSKHVPMRLRRHVANRADNCCEYCLIHQDDTIFGCEIEHIISEKHGGKTVASNLAWACAECNRFKGSDIASFSPVTQKICRLFNPRRDRWSRHFKLRGSRIVGVSNIGKATSNLLDFNSAERIQERQLLILLRRYPPENSQITANGNL